MKHNTSRTKTDEEEATTSWDHQTEKPSSNQEMWTKTNLRSWGTTNDTKQDADQIFPLKSKQSSHLTHRGHHPPSLIWLLERKWNSWHTNPNLRNAYESWRSGNEPQPDWVLFIGPSKRLKCTYGLILWKQQSWGRTVWCSSLHRPVHLWLHLHVTSVMMPRAPPVVAPPPVLRQTRKPYPDLLRG
jgi:hypothetical protein